MDQHTYRDNKKMQTLAVYVGVVLLLVKFTAYFMTNSNAILSDALESIVNVGAGVFGLYALVLSQRPSDREHPYGHGKIEFLSAGFEGGLIFLAGIGIFIKGGYNLIFPNELQNLGVGAILAGVAGLINFTLGYVLESKGKKNHSIVLVAGGKHLKSDAYSSAGLILGVLLTLWTGHVWLDNLMAMLFGAIIIYTGYKVLRSAFAGIMDEQDYPLINGLVSKLNEQRMEDWIDLHNLRIIKYGSKLHIDCHLTIPWYYEVQEAHEVVKTFEEKVMALEKNAFELFVHMDPCRPDSCGLCSKKVCNERKHEFVAKVQWTLENTIQNQKHKYDDLSLNGNLNTDKI